MPIDSTPADFSNRDDLEVEVNEIDSIILSQSCDLVNGKSELVLVCAFYPLNKFSTSLKDQGSGDLFLTTYRIVPVS